MESDEHKLSASLREPLHGKVLCAVLCSACTNYQYHRTLEENLVLTCKQFGEIPNPYLNCECYDCEKYIPNTSSSTYSIVCRNRLENLGHE